MVKADIHWHDLAGTIASEILHAPKTGGDPLEVWPHFHSRIVRYLARNVAGTPWMDLLALIAAVVSAKRYDVATVRGMMACPYQSPLSRVSPGEDTGMGSRELLSILPERRLFFRRQYLSPHGFLESLQHRDEAGLVLA